MINNKVLVNVDHIILENFFVTGIAHKVISEAIDRGKESEDSVSQVLELGATVIQYGNSRDTVDSMSSEIQRIIDRLNYVSQNEYTQILSQHKNNLAEIMSQFLDPARNTSIQVQVQKLIRESGLTNQEAIQKILSGPGGALDSLKSDFDSKIGNVESKQVEILKDLSAITTRLKMNETLDAAYKKGTQKGFDHEISVMQIIENIVSGLKDQVLDVSKELGLEGTKKGDALVKLNEDETNKLNLSYVIEAKDQKLTLPSALKELELGMRNRGVNVGILVFAHKDQLPTNGSSFRVYSGNRILVSLSEESEHLELEVACILARTLAMNQLSNVKETLDIELLNSKVNHLNSVIDESREIEKGSSMIRKGVDTIEVAYKKLRSDALSTLQEIRILANREDPLADL